MNETLWLVINRASGSWSPEVVNAVTEALAGAGHLVSREIDPREDPVDPALLDREGVATVVILAGDGTINSVATALEGWGGGVLTLPGGTTNLLARALHGDAAPADIAARLPQMQRLRRPAIRWSGGTALVEVLAGPGAMWSDVREELRDGGVGPMAEKAMAAIRQSTTGPMVALVDPPLGRVEGYAGVRLDASGGAMEVEGYGADTVGDYLRQGLALVRRNFREGPHDDLGHYDAVLCRSLGKEPLPLMIDGERRDGGPEERFSLAPFALDLLALRG
jgi:hypothetical protein